MGRSGRPKLMGTWLLYPPLQMTVCAASQSTTPRSATATRIPIARRRVRFDGVTVALLQIHAHGPTSRSLTCRLSHQSRNR
jgi:hypothetical protein